MSTEMNTYNEIIAVNVVPEVISLNISEIQTINVDVKGGIGPKGNDGDSATITIGTTTTGEAGTLASVVNVGTPNNAILNFTIPKGENGSGTEQTDYDYNINGSRNGNNKVFVLRDNYKTGTTKVYVNGLRQTLGASYDYTETGSKTITFNYNIDNGDLLIVDYIKL